MAYNTGHLEGLERLRQICTNLTITINKLLKAK